LEKNLFPTHLGRFPASNQFKETVEAGFIVSKETRKNIVSAKPSHNKRYTLPAGQARLQGFRSARSVASLAPTPHSNHIFAVLVLLRKPLFGLQKRRIPGTLCAIVLGLNII
jgi:hypothetical protein